MLELEPYHWWLIAAVLLVFLELVTAGFGVLCFGIAAAFSALAAYFGLSLTWQLLIFAVVSVLCLVFVRPVALKFLTRKEDEFKTNADALIGRTGIVSEAIDPQSHTGRVAVDGDDWKAVSASGQCIEKGVEVEILSRDSLVVSVKPKN